MKKLFMLLMVVCLLGLTACDKKKKDDKVTTETDQQTEVETDQQTDEKTDEQTETGTGSETVTTISIEDAIKAAKDTEVTIKGNVVAVNKSGFVLNDETAAIFVHIKDCEPVVTYGDEAVVTGARTDYKGSVQIQLTDAAKYVVKSQGHKYEGTPVELTEALAKDYLATAKDNYKAMQVTVKGVYTSSEGRNGVKYHNIALGEAKISIPYASNAFETAVADAEGKIITITGWVYGFSCSGDTPTFVNIAFNKLVKVEDKPAPTVVEATVAEALAAKKDTVLKVTGNVIAIGDEAFVLEDTTGVIYVYNKATLTQKVGDKVEVVVTKDEHNSCPQLLLAKAEDYKKLADGEAHKGEATVLTEELHQAYLDRKADEYSMEYYKVTGKYTVSGNFHNIVLGSKTVSLKGLTAEMKETLKPYVNGNITVIVWAYGWSGKKIDGVYTPYYVNTLVAEFVEGEKAPEPINPAGTYKVFVGETAHVMEKQQDKNTWTFTTDIRSTDVLTFQKDGVKLEVTIDTKFGGGNNNLQLVGSDIKVKKEGTGIKVYVIFNNNAWTVAASEGTAFPEPTIEYKIGDVVLTKQADGSYTGNIVVADTNTVIVVTKDGEALDYTVSEVQGNNLTAEKKVAAAGHCEVKLTITDAGATLFVAAPNNNPEVEHNDDLPFIPGTESQN